MEEQHELQPRSLTFSGTDPRKELEHSLPASVSSPDSEYTPERDVKEEEVMPASATAVSTTPVSRTGLGPMETSGVSSHDSKETENEQPGSHRLVQNAMSQDRSRSNTPTPAISIEPELEWTKDMLSGPESEVVTSDTCLAKARGSTTTSIVLFASDDDSPDGLDEVDDLEEEEEEELVFGEDAAGEGGGEDQVSQVMEGERSHAQQTGQAGARTTSPADSDNVCIINN